MYGLMARVLCLKGTTAAKPLSFVVQRGLSADGTKVGVPGPFEAFTGPGVV